MFKLIVLLYCLFFAVSSYSEDELDTYAKLSGYLVETIPNAMVYVDHDFTKAGSIRKEKASHLNGGERDALLNDSMIYFKNKRDLSAVAFKPTLNAVLAGGVMDSIPDLHLCEVIDTSFDDGMFIASASNLIGGVFLFRCFTKETLGVRFMKTYRVRFNEKYLSESLSHLDSDSLDIHLY